MSFQYEGFEGVAAIEPERALNIGVGVASAPLWAAFYASAGLGAAWWWTTAWTRAMPSFNPVALLAPERTPAAEAYIEAIDDAVCDLIETSQDEVEAKAEEIEAVAEAVHESVEIAAETTVEAVEFAHEEVAEAIEEVRLENAEPKLEAAPEGGPEAAYEAPLAFEAAAEELTADDLTADDLPVEDLAADAMPVADLPVEDLVDELAVIEPVAEVKSFKPSKKKTPKT